MFQCGYKTWYSVLLFEISVLVDFPCIVCVGVDNLLPGLEALKTFKMEYNVDGGQVCMAGTHCWGCHMTQLSLVARALQQEEVRNLSEGKA